MVENDIVFTLKTLKFSSYYFWYSRMTFWQRIYEKLWTNSHMVVKFGVKEAGLTLT